MAGSPPNLHMMDSRSACIQVVVKVKVKGHVIRALSWIIGMSYSVIDGLVLTGLPWIWNFPSISISISTDFCVDIHGYIHIHRCLSCVHVATELQGLRGSVPQRPGRRHSTPKIVIIVWICLRINTYLHWNICFVKYFQICYENLYNSNVPFLH